MSERVDLSDELSFRNVVTSVWFWQVAGFSFATVFTQRFELASAGAATADRR